MDVCEEHREGGSLNKIRYRLQIWRQIYPHMNGLKRWFAGDIVSEILLKIISMLFPIIYGVFLESVILERNKDNLIIVVGGYLVLQLVKSVVILFQKSCQNKVNYTVSRKIRVLSLEKYFHMKFEAYGSFHTGDIKMTLEDAVNKLTSFQTQFYLYCMNCVYIVILAVVLIQLGWRLALVAFLFVPITFILDHIVSHSEKNVNQILDANDASWAAWLDETVKCWKEIRINQYGSKRKKEFEDFQAIDETYFRTWLRFWVTRILAIPKIKDDFVMQFVLYFLGGILIYYNYITISVLLVFVQYYGMLSNCVKEISTSDANMQSNMPQYERILKHLANEENTYIDGTLMPELYAVSFENVTFGYPDTEKRILQNVSFHVGAGARVGIYGESGVGKSTVLKLIMGQLEPDAGNIKYGDVLLKDICKEKLYQKIAYISQEASLFQESILENLCLGNENASMESVEEACKRACIYDFIMSLPGGFETQIGENGALLSGGQRQRLLLAKALLRDASLYILDEVTSALDNQIEKDIIDALKCIPKEKTVIIVAHKKQFLGMCDYLVKLS